MSAEVNETEAAYWEGRFKTYANWTPEEREQYHARVEAFRKADAERVARELTRAKERAPGDPTGGAPAAPVVIVNFINVMAPVPAKVRP